MATVDALSIAYQTAKALADVLDTLARSLPLAADAALQARRTVYLVEAVLAPRITAAADVAAIGSTLADAAAAILAASAPVDAAPAFALAAARASTAAPTFASPALTRASALGAMLAASIQAAFLGHGFVAEAKSDFADRPAAVAARARIAAAMDGATDRIAAAAGLAVISLLTKVATTSSAHIASVAADLKPLIQVETLRSAPSTKLAFELYGDPSRAPELIARNRCGTPLFMPTRVVALAADA